MPHLRGHSLLTNQLFWSAIVFLGNFVAFILVRESKFFIDQLGSEELKWQLSTLLVSAELMAPALLICNLIWGQQIRNKCQNNLFLNVVMTYLVFLVLAIAAYLGEYPQLNIEEEEKIHNRRKIHSLCTAVAFAVLSLGLSGAMNLQFEIGVFSFCIACAMKMSLGILKENGRGRNWFYIVGTATFCFLLIWIRKYLDSLQGNHATRANANGHDETGNQLPHDSTANDSVNMETVEAGLQGRPTQIKDGSSMNGDSDTHTGEPSHRRASSVNDEREESEELWSVDEEHWESIRPPRDDMETSSNGSDGDSEDTPLLPPRPQIVNTVSPFERNQDQRCHAEQENSSAQDFEGNQSNMPIVNIDSISEVVSMDRSSFVGVSDSNPPAYIPETLTLLPSYEETDIDAPSVKQSEESSCREKDPEISSAEDFKSNQSGMPNVNIDSISVVVSMDQGSSFIGDSDSNPPPHHPFQETDIDAPSLKQGEESSYREKYPYSSSAVDFEHTRSLVNIGAAGSIDQSSADQNEQTRHQGKDVKEKFVDPKSMLPSHPLGYGLRNVPPANRGSPLQILSSKPLSE